ncbi:MAG TPA: hypothetical protein VM074_07595 [Solimonas sp.]|nr:hypothetical protein [Solimonas sp.]
MTPLNAYEIGLARRPRVSIGVSRKGWRRHLEKLLQRWKQLGRVELDLRGLLYLSLALLASGILLGVPRPAAAETAPAAVHIVSIDSANAYLASHSPAAVGL